MLAAAGPALALALMFAAAVPSVAADEIGCTAEQLLQPGSRVTCAAASTTVDPGRPGQDSGDKSTGAARVCTFQGRGIPCSTEDGWWSTNLGCWVTPVGSTAAAEVEWMDRTSDPYWCTTPGGARSIIGVPKKPPAAAAPPVDPEVVGQRAVDSLELRPIRIGLTPPTGSSAPTLVGIPVWMWADQPDPTTFGPATLTASAGGVTVTAQARVAGITWDMGDGTTVECGAGTPYSPAFAATSSPTCGHRYRTAGTYTVRATSNWVVDWTGGGSSGRITLALDSTASVTVAEAFGLVTGQG
jgi:hypothetical protein